jgi:hypothetical protein
VASPLQANYHIGVTEKINFLKTGHYPLPSAAAAFPHPYPLYFTLTPQDEVVFIESNHVGLTVFWQGAENPGVFQAKSYPVANQVPLKIAHARLADHWQVSTINSFGNLFTQLNLHTENPAQIHQALLHYRE